jgi:hypothetical protein
VGVCGFFLGAPLKEGFFVKNKSTSPRNAQKRKKINHKISELSSGLAD